MTDPKFRKLVDEHYDRIFRAARFMTGSSQAAEDLVQDTFLAAAESLKRFEGRSSPYTWLYGILHNKFRHWIRRKNVRVVPLHARGDDEDQGAVLNGLPADEGADPSQRVEQSEAAEHVRRAIEELSADHRAIITMRYIEGLSYQDIARLIGCPMGTVKSRIHYALDKIGGKLARLGLDSV